MKLLATISILTLLGMSCASQTDCCVILEENVLSGDWQIYERGYSPGDVYITEEVPADPPQILTFTTDGRFSSAVEGFEQYKYYQVSRDSVNSDYILTLLEEEDAPKDTNYTMIFDGQNLKLHYRFCFEGCHLALKRPE